MRDDGADSRLQPIVTGWLAVIEQARAAKKDFQEDADECMNFFSKSSEWLWSDSNKRKFWTGDVKPKFMMTVNKAFELVALFGPLIYHDNPVRTVTPRKLSQFPPELYGITPEFLQYQQSIEQFNQAMQQYEMAMQQGPPPQPEGAPPMMPPQQPMPPMLPPSLQDPMQMQMQQEAFAMYQEQSKAQADAAMQDQFRADLISQYLNYTPNEMPGGGLRLHAQRAINEALLTGRGVLWTQPHTMPGTQTRIIVSEFDSVANLLIDPDATCIEDAKFIVRKCVHPYWQVEDDYGYERDELKDYTHLESQTNQGFVTADPNSKNDRNNGQTNDLIVYYKIWSKMGCGARLTGVDKNSENNQQLDQIFGDYCYMVVAPGIPFPLNLAPHKIGMDEDLTSKLAWEVPYYADERWPCSVLDFYSEPNSAWPKSPLAPGLGWLKFINVMMSALANKIWTTQRTIMGVKKSANPNVKTTMEQGRDLVVLDLDGIEGERLDQVVSFLQAPVVNGDVWQILDAAMEEFKRVTGMNDLLYGLPAGGSQSRSAADAQAKQQGVSIRPDFMAKQVEAWATEQARKEAMCARWFIEPQDVEPVLGPQAAKVWQTLVLDQDVNKVVREMEFRVEAASARKPNKDRDIANSNQAMQQLFPPLFQYGMQTGNVNPVNALIGQLGQAIDMPTEGMMLSPPPPQPPPQPAAPPPQAA
jgi:hypothetical protein